MRARKNERLTALSIQRCIHCKGLAHIHRVARRVADDGVRAMHRPREAMGGSFAKQHILLGVVEVQSWQSRLVFAEGRFRHGLAVGLKWAEVLLGSRHERRMLQRLTSSAANRFSIIAPFTATFSASLGCLSHVQKKR